MIEMQNIVGVFKRSGILVASAFACLYFAAGALTGPSSIKTLDHIKGQQADLEIMANSLAVVEADLLSRVSDFQASDLDPDRLEEEVRKSLGFAHPDEIIILIASAN